MYFKKNVKNINEERKTQGSSNTIEVYRRRKFRREKTPFLLFLFLCFVLFYFHLLLQLQTILLLDKKPSRENSFPLLSPCPRHNVLEIHAQYAAYKKRQGIYTIWQAPLSVPGGVRDGGATAWCYGS